MIGKLTNEQIEEVLVKNVFGHIGCNDGYNTYVYPLNYMYNGKHIICHSPAGSKIQIMRQNKRVCFQVDDVKNFITWKSVMVLGEYQELVEERDRYDAMKEFVDRMLHIKIKETVLIPGLAEEIANSNMKGNARPVFYRIIIDEKNGRYEVE